jgi:peptidoglycan hydrolase-like protein with peptidoglycan-binding domain
VDRAASDRQRRVKRLSAALALAAALAFAAPAGAAAAPATLRPLAGGQPPLLADGQSLRFEGTAPAAAAGQRVTVLLLEGLRARGSRTVTVGPRGHFTASFVVHGEGSVRGVAVHRATARFPAFAARSRGVRVVDPNIAPGSTRPSVRVLQWELASLGFAVPVNGVYEQLTALALVAYRKALGLARTEAAGPAVVAAMERERGRFPVRYPGDGRHIEANLALQLLAEIEHGRVVRVYTMSSGKPSTPTVLGRFFVYRREPGTNGEGMVDSNYFYTGYAIHGYHEVPTWAASHGCLRIPIPDAPAVFAWVHMGTRVDVYYP